MNKTFWYITAGVAAALVLNSTIAGVVNPLLASVKLSVSLQG